MSAAQTPAVITVVVADDQTVVREGLRAMLGFLPGIDVVATAPSAEEALEAVSRLDPDVLLTDLRMPGIGGVEGIRRLRASGARTAAVALTTYDDDATVREALGAGALGFLNKDAEPEAVADALRAAAAGRSLLDARVVAALL
uniref:response regulator n=1 Tax=Piscicoccus intestinalis TaxID=746033 RepID=UPI0012EDCFE1